MVDREKRSNRKPSPRNEKTFLRLPFHGSVGNPDQRGTRPDKQKTDQQKLKEERTRKVLAEKGIEIIPNAKKGRS